MALAELQEAPPLATAAASPPVPSMTEAVRALAAGPLQAELDALWARIAGLCRTPFDPSTDYFISVLDARAHASELALRAAQSALMHAGARGYLLSSDVQRRVRESHFVAIVSPAIKHLRKEIARLSAAEMPA